MFCEPAFSLNAHPAKSIGQSPRALPDFRTLSVITRVLIGTNAAALAAAMVRSDALAEVPERFARIAMTLEPAVLCALSLLYAISAMLLRLPYPAALAVALAVAAACAAAIAPFTALLGQAAPRDSWWNAGYALAIAGVLAVYFDLRERAFRRRSGGRLQALQARIRPHFLFNSLNAVLALIRRDPRRAERRSRIWPISFAC